MRKLLASIVCFAAVAVGATAGGDKSGKIEGTWIATAIVNDGETVPEENVKKAMLTVVFQDGKYTVELAGKEVETGKYKTDAAKKPATIDLDIVKGKESDQGKMQLGIYKIEGETLTIAMTPAGTKERPKDFEPPKKGEVTVLKRTK